MADKYPSFAALAKAEQEGADFRVLRRVVNGAGTAIVAPHGGAIEPGTSEIAGAIAGADFSFYAFEGLKSSDNGDLHITSSRFDEPRCIELITASARVVTIHGEGSNGEVVYLGGLDTKTATRLKESLKEGQFAAAVQKDPEL